MSTPNNKCAFPSVYEDRTVPGCTRTVVNEGMSLRAYFAGQAMVGLLADGTINVTAKKAAEKNSTSVHDEYAKDAVRFADALIAELAKTK